MMATDDLPYSYNEKKNSGNESWDILQGRRILTRIFEGPWSDRYNFITEYIGASLLDGDTSLGNPHPSDSSTAPSRLSITGSGATNIDTSTKLISHDRAIITVEYTKFPYSIIGISGDRTNDYPDFLYLTESISSEVEMLELEDKNVIIKWAADGIELPKTKKYQHPVHYLRYEIHVPVHTFVPTPEDYTDYDGYDAYFDIVSVQSRAGGRVNQYRTRTFSGLVFPAKTLLYEGITSNSSQDFHLDDRGVYNTTLQFRFNNIGWDRSYDVNASGAVAEVILDPPPYTGVASFDILFPGLFSLYQAS